MTVVCVLCSCAWSVSKCGTTLKFDRYILLLQCRYRDRWSHGPPGPPGPPRSPPVPWPPSPRVPGPFFATLAIEAAFNDTHTLATDCGPCNDLTPVTEARTCLLGPREWQRWPKPTRLPRESGRPVSATPRKWPGGPVPTAVPAAKQPPLQSWAARTELQHAAPDCLEGMCCLSL